MKIRLTGISLAILLLNASLLLLVPGGLSDENDEIQTWVMIDFGNGKVEWTKVGLGENQTAINATEQACLVMGLELTTSWSQWGAFVSEIGGLSSPDWSWWWGFYIWNRSRDVWEASSVGASSLNLTDGDTIGWSPTWDYLDPAKPTATPLMKYPWPMFRHDAMNSGYAAKSGPKTNAVSWVFDTKTTELAASPAVVGNKVVVNNWAGVFCFSENGKVSWVNKGVVGSFSPAVAYDRVFVGGKDGYLYSLDFENGGILWKTRITSSPGISGVTSSPTVDRGKVYVGAFNFSGGPGGIFCLDARTGAVVWMNGTSGSVYFLSPAVYKDKVFVGTMGLYNSSSLEWSAPYGLYCFEAQSGNLMWNTTIKGPVGSSPAIEKDRVLFTSKDGYLYCLDAGDGTPIWKKLIGSSVSSPAVSDGKIFVGSGEMGGEGMLYSLDLAGNILWKYKPNGAVQSSPSVCGDLVYFTTNVKSGMIYCLDTEDGKPVWEYKPWPEQYLISSPAIVDGKMFVGSDNGRLYCFGGDLPSITVNQTAQPVTVHFGEDIVFVHESQKGRLRISDAGDGTVTLVFDSMKDQVEVALGRAEELDTDGDRVSDMVVLIEDVNTTSQTALLSLDVFSEQKAGKDERVPLAMMAAFLVVLSVVIVGIASNLKKRR